MPPFPEIEVRFGRKHVVVCGLVLGVFTNVVYATWIITPVFINGAVQATFDVPSEVTALASSLLFVGWGVASPAFGVLSDRRGRRGCLLASLAVGTWANAWSALSTSFWSYCGSRFGVGVALGGGAQSMFHLLIELSPRASRNVMNCVQAGSFSLGVALLCAAAYWALEVLRAGWRALLLAIAALSLLGGLLVAALVPESPPSLAARGRELDALKVVEAFARSARDAPALARVAALRAAAPPKAAAAATPPGGEGPGGRAKPNICVVLRPSLRAKTLVLAFTWLTATLVYYGISFAAGALAGNVYVNSLALALVDVPATLLGAVIVDRPGVLTGRRGSQASFLALATVMLGALSALAFAASGTAARRVELALALVGKVGAAGTFNVVYLLTSEVLPTSVRGAGFGLCNIAARAGGVLAPFSEVLPLPLVYLLFASVGLVAALLVCTTLEETLGRPLPATMAEDELAATADGDEGDAEEQTSLLKKRTPG